MHTERPGYSTSAYNGRVKFADSAYYLKKQFFATSIGLMAMYLVSQVDYRRWLPAAGLGYGISLVLSTAVLFIGDEYNGSRRWLSLGPLSFQPSEFAKLAVVVLLASIVSKNASHMKSWRYMFLVILQVLPIVGLVGTNNLSTAIIILGIAVILIFIANPRFLPFIGLGGLGAGFIGIFLSVESYRLERLAIWRHPELYEKGYQTMQGLYAIGSGCKEQTESGRHKKIYFITDVGKAQFTHWIHEPMSASSKHPELSKLYFMGFCEQKSRLKSLRSHILELRQQYEVLCAICVDGEAMEREYVHNDIFYYQLITARYGRDWMKFNIEWYETLYKEINEGEGV